MPTETTRTVRVQRIDGHILTAEIPVAKTTVKHNIQWPADEADPLDELVAQAQALDMGYGPPASPTAERWRTAEGWSVRTE